MKLRVMIIGLLFLSCSLFGQTAKTGFIGLNIGTSYILNKQPKDVGVGANLNLINFGYEIKNGFGVTLKWMGSAHSYKTLDSENEIGYGAILVGPMYSVAVSENIKLDFKIQPGLFWVSEKTEGAGFKGSFQKISISGLSAGVTFRHNFTKRWCWMLLVDYNSGLTPGGLNTEKRLNTISTNVGVGFRI